MKPETRRSRGRPRSNDPRRQAHTVAALDKGLSILKSLAKAGEAGLTELALATGNSPSTVHRMLMTFQQHGIVEFQGGPQTWNIGVEAYRIGAAFTRRTNIVAAGRPVLRELMEVTGETANLGIADDCEVVFISQVESRHTIRAFYSTGTRGPLHTSGIGKALLAQMPRNQVEKIMRKAGLPSFTPKSLSTPDDLFADLEKTVQRGWAIDDEERNIGMRCLAAPVWNEHGEAVAGISVSGPTERLNDERIGEFGPSVKRAAEKLTEAIGGAVHRS